MKIGYFIEKFPYEDQYSCQEIYPCSGAEVAAEELAYAVSKQCGSVRVFTTSINSQTAVECQDSVTIHRYGTTFHIVGRNVSIPSLYRTPKLGLDICHTHVSTEPLFPFIAKRHSKYNSCPLVLTCHINPGASRENTPLTYQIASKTQEKSLLKAFSYADVIISPSEQIMQQSPLLQRYSDKIEVIPNGINLNAYNVSLSKEECRKVLNIPQNRTMLLFVGNPHPNKGADILVNAMVKIVQEQTDVQLFFVGEGKFRQTLESLARKLNLTEKVTFVGYVPEIQKRMYYKAADIFLLPSYFDVHPLVLLEASSYSLPLVVSDIPALYGFIEDKHNGVVTRVGDVKDLSQKIIELLDDKDYRICLGQNARRKVETEYTWDIVAAKTTKLYERLLGR